MTCQLSLQPGDEAINEATDKAMPITSLRLPHRVRAFTSVPVEVISKPNLVFPVEEG